MNPPQHRLRFLERRKATHVRRGGFSLLEVMVVMGLVAIVATFSVTSVSSTYQANRIDGNIATLSGLMERAHEAAIANNSYVWVAFTDNPPAASPATGVAAVVFAAQDGSDAFNNFNVGTSASPVVIDASTGFHVLNAVQSFPGIDLTMPVPLPRLPVFLPCRPVPLRYRAA